MAVLRLVHTARSYIDSRLQAGSRAGIADGTPAPNAVHSPDFRSVEWFGTSYTFSTSQAACVEVLWENWDRRTPEVGGPYKATFHVTE